MQRRDIPYELLVPTKGQARTLYRNLDTLAISVFTHGLLQNLVVRETEDGKFEVEAGERRRRAIGILHLPADKQIEAFGKFIGDWTVASERSGAKDGGVPCFVLPAGLKDSVNLIENIERENLLVWEFGRRLAALNDAGYNQEWMASHLQRSSFYVAQRVQIGRYLSPRVTEALERAGTDLLSLRDLCKIARKHDPILQEPLHEEQIVLMEKLLGGSRREASTDTHGRDRKAQVYQRAKRLQRLGKLPGHARPYVKAICDYLFDDQLSRVPNFNWD